MFQFQAICAVQNYTASNRPSGRASGRPSGRPSGRSSGRHVFFAMEPGVIARRVLPILAAGALVAAVAAVPHGVAAPTLTSPVIVQDASVTSLRDKTEAMRAQLSDQPGVTAVIVSGLRQQGLSVEYTPRRLASFGLTPASLAAALPTDAAASRPGHLALRADASADLQDLANLPVRAGGQVFRLGDVAMVMRSPLATPVSTMSIQGQPAVVLQVVAAR